MEKQYFGEIAKLMHWYVRTNEEVNINYIEELINIIIYYEELQDYITSVDRSPIKRGVEYNPRKKQITFAKDILDKRIPLPESLTKYQQKYYKYLYITRLFLKEIEHSKQIKLCNQTVLSNQGNAEAFLKLQATILEMSYNIFNKKLDTLKEKEEKVKQKEANEILNRNKWHENYRLLAPEERMAEIDSFNALFEIGEYIDLESLQIFQPEDLAQIAYGPYKTVIALTHKTTSPTSFYLQKLGYKRNALKYIEKEAAILDQEQKLYLGLKLDPKFLGEMDISLTK